MTTHSFNAHAFKFLLESIQLKFSDLEFKSEKDFIELAHRITKIERNIDTYDDSYFSVKVVTLRRYWGYHKYGSPYRRYTPNEIILDILARICNFGNWKRFQEEVIDSKVSIVLPYESKIDYQSNGIWYREKSKVGDIFYLGDENKYIAIENTKFGIEMFDFKNVPFNSFIWLEIEGVEVIKKENQEINIRFIY